MTRTEQIISLIISDGKQKSINAAWKYAKSVSAKSEAELVTITANAQKDIVSIISSIRSKSLENYKTQKPLEKVQNVLARMIGDYDVVARRMITANFIAGKLKSAPNKANINLTETDQNRIDKMVVELVGRVHKGAALTLESVKSMIHNASIKANMKLPASTQNSSEDVKQEPININQQYDQIEEKRPQRIYKDVPLTKKETQEIKNNPIEFANNESKLNVSFVARMHKEYLKQNSEKPKTKNVSEEMNSAEKVSSEMNNSLQTNGLYAFSDISGRRWSLVNYCAMATRTASSQSTNFGEVFANNEHDLYYIVPHSGSCPLCKKYEGKVYSRSGTNPNYPALASVFNKIDPNGTNDLDNTYMTIHPNCRHKVIPYFEKKQTPAKRKDMMVKSNESTGLTDEQQKFIRDNKEKERLWNERSAVIRKSIKKA